MRDDRGRITIMGKPHFLRGVNGGKIGAFSDPNATDRVAAFPGGVVGDKVGSYQRGAIGSHNHMLIHYDSGGDPLQFAD